MTDYVILKTEYKGNTWKKVFSDNYLFRIMCSVPTCEQPFAKKGIHKFWANLPFMIFWFYDEKSKMFGQFFVWTPRQRRIIILMNRWESQWSKFIFAIMGSNYSISYIQSNELKKIARNGLESFSISLESKDQKTRNLERTGSCTGLFVIQFKRDLISFSQIRFPIMDV